MHQNVFLPVAAGSRSSIKTVVGISTLGDINKQLTGVNEVTFGFDGIVLDFRGDHTIIQFCIVNAVITSLDVAGKVFTDEAVKQGAEYNMVEAAGIEPASASPLPLALHAYPSLLI